MYEADGRFDEMRTGDGTVRPAYKEYRHWFDQQDSALLSRKHCVPDFAFRRTGSTFDVYGAHEAEERLLPFDMVPRIITADEWRRLMRGIEQRVCAINAFIHDLYHRQEVVRAGLLPE